MNTTYPSSVHVYTNGRGAWVTYPNITTLREVLDTMERNGVPTDEPLMIGHLSNALGTFTIGPLSN